MAIAPHDGSLWLTDASPSAYPYAQVIPGLAAIAARYDVFILDQYGVLHNGSEPYRGAVACLRQLLAAGKTVVLLSNTSKRAVDLPPKLASLGFPTDFLGSVTGGEVAWRYLDERRSTLSKCSLITSSLEESVADRQQNPRSLFHGLDVQVVPVDQAEYLVVEGTEQVCYSDKVAEAHTTGYRDSGVINAAVKSFLEEGRKRDLPLLCTNPDVLAVVAGETVVHMGGGIAKEYEAMGGTVVYFGKPRREHFQVCLDMAKVTPENLSRVVHVGDSLHHDVQGAKNTGIDSVFIAAGIHAPELQVNAWSDNEEDLHIKPELLERLLEDSKLFPTYACTHFTW